MIEETKSLLEKKVTRRDFLKSTGMGALGVTALTWLFPGCSTDKKSNVAMFETASGVIIHESYKCTGCLLCESSCSMVNDGKSSQTTARVKVSKNMAYGPDGVNSTWWKNAGTMGNFKMVADLCRQCEKPACALACPENAIFMEEKVNAREVDPEKCVGCGTCTRACPWGIPTIDPETNVSTKCVLCHGYSACVSVCPTGALSFVSWEEAISKYKAHFQVDA